jgi:hypothetical protein
MPLRQRRHVAPFRTRWICMRPDCRRLHRRYLYAALCELLDIARAIAVAVLNPQR